MQKLIDRLNNSVSLMVIGSLFMYPGLIALAHTILDGEEESYEWMIGLGCIFSFGYGSYLFRKSKKELFKLKERSGGSESADGVRENGLNR